VKVRIFTGAERRLVIQLNCEDRNVRTVIKLLVLGVSTMNEYVWLNLIESEFEKATIRKCTSMIRVKKHTALSLPPLTFPCFSFLKVSFHVLFLLL
jgi:hypothetical protein